VLAQRFLEDVASQSGLVPKRLTPDALAQLARYPWPGNIRELRNCMESLTLTSPGWRSTWPTCPTTCAGSLPLPRSAWRWAAHGGRGAEIIRRTVEAYPTLKDAARVLGIGLRTLHTKLRRYQGRPAPPPSAGSAPKPGV